MKKLDLIGLRPEHVSFMETMYKILNRNRDLESLTKLLDEKIERLENGEEIPEKKEEIVKPVFKFNIN